MNLVLTGSSSGIGRALATRLLAQGHRVWGFARSDQADFVRQHPGKFFASTCDIAHWAEIECGAAEVAAAWPHVDGLITCAGLQGEIARTIAASPERWSSTVRINLDGTFFAIRAFAPLLGRAPRRGKIVCFSGGGATKARERFSAYAAAKTAVVRLVENIADEERASPLDVNAIAPGAINTRLTHEIVALGPQVVGKAEFTTAQKQLASGGGSITRALDCVEWLLSAASDGISGRLISAAWDDWASMTAQKGELAGPDTYKLRRMVPPEAGRASSDAPFVPAVASRRLKVTVAGLWHLGSVTAACVAKHADVVGLDFRAETVQQLSEGRAPLFEPGLNELVAAGISNVELARRMGTRPQELQRVLDLHHATKIDTIASALLAIGKRLSDQVYLEYEQGITTAANVVRLSLALTRRLSLRAETNQRTSGFGLSFQRAFD